MTDHEKPPPRSTPPASKFHAVDGGRAPGQSSWLGPEESSELESWFQEDEAQDPEAVRDEMNKTRTLEFPPWLLRLAVLYGEGRLAGTRTEGRRGVEESGRVRPSAGRRGASTTTHPALPRNVRGAVSDTTLEALSQRSEAPLVLERDAVPVRSYRSRVLGVGVALFAVSVGLVIVVVRPEGASRPELVSNAQAPTDERHEKKRTAPPNAPQRPIDAATGLPEAAPTTESGTKSQPAAPVSTDEPAAATPAPSAPRHATAARRPAASVLAATRRTLPATAVPQAAERSSAEQDGSDAFDGRLGMPEQAPRTPRPRQLEREALEKGAPF